MTDINKYRPEPTGDLTLEWLLRELHRISYDLEELHMSGYDFGLEVARGNVSGMSKVNKFGRAPSGVQTTLTDIWDRADSTPTQSVWVAPTTARVHAIVSTSTSDDGDPAGVGARTIQVYGLTSWSTAETSEVITLDGTTPVNTSNSYVIIHRMKVLTKGATNVNVGVITATAATDGTVTAQINAGEGQTQMAIYGIPSTKTAYMRSFYGTVNKSSGTLATINFCIKVNPEPDAEPINFLTKNTRGVQSTGTSSGIFEFEPPFTISGPAIIKVSAEASSNDIEASAGFDLYLEDN